MALKGTLKDFSLADILQLIGIQRKTGVLNLHGSEDLVSISFVQGTIVSAESAQRRLEDRVATILMKWGHCTQDQLADARQTQRQTLERLWIVLLRQQSVSSDEVRRALQLQVEKIIYPVFRWQNGEYSFIQEAEIDFDRDHLTPIHSETVLMEGVRMLDEWPLLERKIRSADLVFSRAPVGGQVVVDDDADGVGQAEGNVIRMSGEEFRIYDLVDGLRTVADIQEIAPTHDFNTASILCNLLGLGIITPLGDGRSSAGRLDTGSAGRGKTPRVVGAAFLWLAAAAILTFTVPRLQLNPLNIIFRDLTDGGRIARLRMLRDSTRLQQLVPLLEAYRLETGSYPRQLTDLTESGFADQAEIIDNRGELFAYRASGDNFTLTAHPRPQETDSIPDPGEGLGSEP
jgi:hypothetical protein